MGTNFVQSSYSVHFSIFIKHASFYPGGVHEKYYAVLYYDWIAIVRYTMHASCASQQTN